MDVFFDNLQVIHTRGPILEETHYYSFGLTMAGISSKAGQFGGAENRLKFNDGNELQAKEFSDGSGLEIFDAFNRMYDPQLGRFWQVDELAEATWEQSTYAFAHNDPIQFNDPLGLTPGEPCNPGFCPDNRNVLPNVTIRSISRGFWAKQRLYYQVMNYLNSQNASIDQIRQDNLRDMMYRFDAITKHRERVSEMTRAGDEVALEVGAWFVPTGWLLKLRYVKLVAKLFQSKRGKGAVEAAEEVLNHGDEVVKAGDDVVAQSVESVAPEAAKGVDKIKYIGRMEDLKDIPRSQTLLDQLPNLGSPKANYYQNMSVLRGALRDGYTIKDASFFRLNSELAPTLLNPNRTIGQTFLGAERLLLQNRGLWP